MIAYAYDNFVYKDDSGVVITVNVPRDPSSLCHYDAVCTALERIQHRLRQSRTRFDEEQAQAFHRVLGLAPAPPEESATPQ